jgi:hypothetical protein
MNEQLLEFAAKAKNALKTMDGIKARATMATELSHLLTNKDAIADIFSGDISDRHLLYEDEELGFCILAHRYKGARTAPPHDHADCWAIYGQVSGETHMRDYEILKAPSGDVPGVVRETRTYHLAPGDAHIYEVGDIHSPARHAPTELIRIEERNMAGVPRAKFIEAQDS